MQLYSTSKKFVGAFYEQFYSNRSDENLLTSLSFSSEWLTMDYANNLQDVLRCHHCETPMPLMYCEICLKNVCHSCVGIHLDSSVGEHKVVPVKQKGHTQKCPEHSTKICELYCEECNIPICASCVSSGNHELHRKEDISKTLIDKKELVEEDFKELKNSIFPQYQEALKKIPFQKAEFKETFRKPQNRPQKPVGNPT